MASDEEFRARRACARAHILLGGRLHLVLLGGRALGCDQGLERRGSLVDADRPRPVPIASGADAHGARDVSR